MPYIDFSGSQTIVKQTRDCYLNLSVWTAAWGSGVW